MLQLLKLLELLELLQLLKLRRLAVRRWWGEQWRRLERRDTRLTRAACLGVGGCILADEFAELVVDNHRLGGQQTRERERRAALALVSETREAYVCVRGARDRKSRSALTYVDC